MFIAHKYYKNHHFFAAFAQYGSLFAVIDAIKVSIQIMTLL